MCFQSRFGYSIYDHTTQIAHQEEGKGLAKYGVEEVLCSGRSQAEEVHNKEILTTGVVHQSEVGAAEQNLVGVLRGGQQMEYDVAAL